MTLDSGVLLGALLIFALRVLGVSIATVRMLITVRGRLLLSVVMGFFEALVFAVAIGKVVTQLDNFWYMMAYCGGFALGTYIGMVIEARFLTNFVTVNVVSPHKAHEIAAAVRQSGFGATEGWGQGAEGVVGWVRIVVLRRDARKIIDCVNAVDEGAFITMDETRAVRHGYLRTGRV